jgi:hypothetical protein
VLQPLLVQPPLGDVCQVTPRSRPAVRVTSRTNQEGLMRSEPVDAWMATLEDPREQVRPGLNLSAFHPPTDGQHGQAEQNRAENAKQDLHDVTEASQAGLRVSCQPDYRSCAVDQRPAERRVRRRRCWRRRAWRSSGCRLGRGGR